MYKEAEEDDTRVKIFLETGTIVFVKDNRIMRIRNSETRVCIVVHKALAQFEDMPDKFKNMESFVMIYKFKGINGNVGATLIQSCVNLDNHEIKFFNSYKETKNNFVQLMKTAASSTDRNIIYYGARNEG